MRTIEFRGMTFEYDDRCTKSYKWQKKALSGDSGRALVAIEDLFAGRDEEYAEMLGDDAEAMQELIAAVVADTNESKN